MSHDRQFLDNVCTDIVHLHQRTLTYYRGNYSSFERQRGERLKVMQREFSAQQAKRAHIQSFIDKCSLSIPCILYINIFLFDTYLTIIFDFTFHHFLFLCVFSPLQC